VDGGYASISSMRGAESHRPDSQARLDAGASRAQRRPPRRAAPTTSRPAGVVFAVGEVGIGGVDPRCFRGGAPTNNPHPLELFDNRIGIGGQVPVAVPGNLGLAADPHEDGVRAPVAVAYLLDGDLLSDLDALRWPALR
jgi:hypothetical protein